MASKIIKNQYFPAALVILDGYGLAPSGAGNAVRLANTPFLNKIFSSYPYTELRAAGESVSLFPGATGNSEAGRPIWEPVELSGRTWFLFLILSKMVLFQNAAFLKLSNTQKIDPTCIMGPWPAEFRPYLPRSPRCAYSMTREQG